MRRFAQYLILAGLVATACGQKSNAPSDFAAQRQLMVQQQLVVRGINNEGVLAAMGKVPREEFVPLELRTDT